MKKFLIFAITVSSLFGTSVNLKSGWNLVGTPEDISPSDIECSKSVWTYDGSVWSLYMPDAPENNYNITKLTQINQYEGFWVNAEVSGECKISFEDTSNDSNDNDFSAYGLNLSRATFADKFLVDNENGKNAITFDGTKNEFLLEAYRSDGNDSESRLVINDASYQPIQSISASLRLDTEGNTSENRSQLVVGKMMGDEFLGVGSLYAGLNMKADGAGAWYEIWYEDGYFPLHSKAFTNSDMRNKNVTAKIAIDGTKIVYTLSGDVNASYVLDTIYTDVTLQSPINQAFIRSRVKDDTTTSTADTYTKVTVSDIGIQNATSPYEMDFTISWETLSQLKPDSRYMYGPNHISYDNDSSSFVLKSYKNLGSDSRTGLFVKQLDQYPAKSISANMKLNTVGTNSNNRAQLISKFKIKDKELSESYAAAGINIHPGGVNLFFEKVNSDGTYEELYSIKPIATSAQSKNLLSRIEVNGTKIIYQVSGDETIYQEIDTTEYTDATIDSQIIEAEIRSRTKNDNDLDTALVTEAYVSKVYIERESDTFSAYGLDLYDRKDRSRYLISNALGTNGVEYNSSTQQFTITSFKSENETSDAGLKVDKSYMDVNPKSSATVSLHTLDLSTNNIIKVILWGFDILGDDTKEGGVSLGLTSTGAYVHYEVEDKDTFASTIYLSNHQINSQDLGNKDINVSISIEGTQVHFALSGDVNSNYTYDTATSKAINSKIKSLEIRARTNGANTDKEILQSTKVIVNDMKMMD